jgi:hypothetical protein
LDFGLLRCRFLTVVFVVIIFDRMCAKFSREIDFSRSDKMRSQSNLADLFAIGKAGWLKPDRLDNPNIWSSLSMVINVSNLLDSCIPPGVSRLLQDYFCEDMQSKRRRRRGETRK